MRSSIFEYLRIMSVSQEELQFSRFSLWITFFSAFAFDVIFVTNEGENMNMKEAENMNIAVL